MNASRTIENIEYVNRAGTGLCLDLHLPAEGNGPWPVVVGIPGGGWYECAKTGFPVFLVDHGFAMACIDYRVSGVAIAPANVHDCKAALRWVRANARQYGLDPARVGVYGTSAGGHLAALVGVSGGVAALEGDGAVPGAAVQAFCDVCGPTDLARAGLPEMRQKFQALYEVTSKYLGGPVADRGELARLVSPMTYVSKDSPPALLLHGDADPIVPVEESLLFHAAMQKAGARCSLRVVKGAGHSWLLEEAADSIVAFFKDTLRPG